MITEGYFLTKKGAAAVAFELREFELANPLDDEVSVAVEAFGLNYADVMARQGLYREAPPMPCIIGYEVVGIVTAVGAASDAGLLGKRVVAFCRFGGYAKQVNTKNFAVAEIGTTDAGEALALATQFVTAQYMVSRSANVQADEYVLIHAAAGGVGTALIQLVNLRGAHAIAKVSSENKMKLCQDLGAKAVINYKNAPYDEQIKKLVQDRRLDVSFNPVAGSTFKKDWKLLGSGGRLVLFGGSELSNGKWGILSTLNFVRKMGFIVPIGLMMRSKAVLGVNMLKIADNKPEVLKQCLHEVVELLQAGHIKPIVGGVYQQADLHVAHDALEKGGTIGKLIVKWDEI